MSKRVAVEVKVIEFFQDAPLIVAKSIFAVVKGNLERRKMNEVEVGGMGKAIPTPKPKTTVRKASTPPSPLAPEVPIEYRPLEERDRDAGYGSPVNANANRKEN